MLHLRPALKYFCSLSLHEDISFMTRILPSSTRSKKYNSTTEKPQCEFSFLHLSSFENVCFSFSPSKPYAPPLPSSPKRAVAHRFAVRHTLLFVRLAAPWTKRTFSPRVSTLKLGLFRLLVRSVERITSIGTPPSHFCVMSGVGKNYLLFGPFDWH